MKELKIGMLYRIIIRKTNHTDNIIYKLVDIEDVYCFDIAIGNEENSLWFRNFDGYYIFLKWTNGMTIEYMEFDLPQELRHLYE